MTDSNVHSVATKIQQWQAQRPNSQAHYPMEIKKSVVELLSSQPLMFLLNKLILVSLEYNLGVPKFCVFIQIYGSVVSIKNNQNLELKLGSKLH